MLSIRFKSGSYEGQIVNIKSFELIFDNFLLFSFALYFSSEVI
jgi:hypothetical protein